MKKPNIIILNPDEMRWDTMGHMGNSAAHTPNLDEFASTEAVSFSHAYCQSPVCVPSRCSFLTGLYPHTKGHRTMQYLLHENESSLFSDLKQAGYYVWMNARNDLVAGQISGLAESHADEIYYYDKSKPLAMPSPQVLQGLMRGNENALSNPYPYSHFVGLVQQGRDNDWDDTRAAVDRILHPIEPNKPLCLFLGWTNPHPPYMAEEPYFSSIDRTKITNRVKFEETKNKSLMIRRLHELVGMDEYTEKQWTELRAVYLAQCAKIDTMFKMVVDALKEAGEYDNSAIFFLSDHGDFVGDYGLPEKAQNTFEDCLTRVPLLIKPPKGYNVDPGVSDSLAELVDFYATALDYAQVEPVHDHFGRSLRAVVENRNQTVRSYVCAEGGRLAHETQCDEWHAEGENGPATNNEYWPKMTAQKDPAAHEKGTMIFDGRYKYIQRLSGADELYDLQEDPGERMNLFGSPEWQPCVEKLRLAMLQWYQETCDVVPKKYDSRFTEERIWAAVRPICGPALEMPVREYIRKNHAGMMETFRYAIGLMMQAQAGRQ